MKQWGVYILRCRDDTLYTGITDDLARRVALHNAGKGAKYTRGRAPLTAVYWEPCEDLSSAGKREYAIKQLPRTEKLALCRSPLNRLASFSARSRAPIMCGAGQSESILRAGDAEQASDRKPAE